MFVMIIFDTDYYVMEGRLKWFLKNLSHAKANNWMVITHEHLGRHYKEYAMGCAERFYNEFEMRHLDSKEYEEIRKGFVPDAIFEEIEKRFVSRTEALLFLFENRVLQLEDCLIQMIDNELKNSPGERVEGIFNCLDCYKSIHYLGEHYGCPVIPYSFSAIRKMHGYRQTLYFADLSGCMRSSQSAEQSCRNYLKSECPFPIFSRRELLALFGKDKNLPLLRLLDAKPKYEVGICKTPNSIYPYDFLKFKYTDVDVYYEAKQFFEEDSIVIRDHPNIPWNGSDKGFRKEHQRNDPISFLLSCERVVSVNSQILLKALLWNRAVCLKGDLSSFGFMCNKDIKETKRADIDALNYYIFGYLIPAELMFDAEYWKWRINKKVSEYDIYRKHFEYYLKYFDLEEGIIYNNNETERFRYILMKRGCCGSLIDKLVRNQAPENFDYEVLYSKLTADSDSALEVLQIFSLNKSEEGKISSVFEVRNEDCLKCLYFYPFADVGGFADIRSITINDEKTDVNEGFVYFDKTDGKRVFEIRLPAGKHRISVEWEYYFK